MNLNLLLLVLILTSFAPASDEPPLVTGEKLKYVGSFDIPPYGTWKDSLDRRFDYSLGTIGYRDDLDALYVVTHAQNPTAVGLVKVPQLLSKSQIPVAEFLQEPKDLRPIADRKSILRGLFWDPPTETLYYNFTAWYNVSGKDAAGFGALRDGEFYGPWFVAHNNACAGYITRNVNSNELWMGSAVAQGIASSSLGPSAYSLLMDENNLPVANTKIQFKTKMFFPHETSEPDPSRKYAKTSKNLPWIHGMAVYGGVCVEGSLMVAVDEGSRSFYGTAEQFQKEFGIAPRSLSKGYHNDPYTPMLWMYSLKQIEQHSIKSDNVWRSQPYEYYRISELPAGAMLSGLTYDSRNRRLFISQAMGNKANTPHLRLPSRAVIPTLGIESGSKKR